MGILLIKREVGSLDKHLAIQGVAYQCRQTSSIEDSYQIARKLFHHVTVIAAASYENAAYEIIHLRVNRLEEQEHDNNYGDIKNP